MKNKIVNDITECIGKTPLVYMDQMTPALKSRIAAKLEFFNPSGSVKDRIIYNILLDAEKRGILKAGDTIIESTSGNTGIALATLCAVRGYRLLITMPDTMSLERRRVLRAYGAELIITPGESGMRGAIQKAEELLEEIPDAFMPQQFNNLSNPEAHQKTTAVEIWEESEGKIDYLVAGIGTGGTITGVGRFLKKKDPAIQVIGIEPAGSPVFSGGQPGRHLIQGIGPGFIPRIYEAEVVNRIITVSDEDAFATTREIARKTGILAGISAGAAMVGALQIARSEKNKKKLIVVIFPDNGYKYLNMGLFE